jgi:hypothetical protein
MSVKWDAYGVTFYTNGYTSYQNSRGFGGGSTDLGTVSQNYYTHNLGSYSKSTTIYNTTGAPYWVNFYPKYGSGSGNAMIYVDDVLVAWTGLGSSAGYYTSTVDFFVPKSSYWRWESNEIDPISTGDRDMRIISQPGGL